MLYSLAIVKIDATVIVPLELDKPVRERDAHVSTECKME